MTEGRVVVVGDALLDRDVEGRVDRLSPEAPVPVIDDPQDRSRPGGAGLAAALAALDGRAVTLVTALADDAAAAELRALLGSMGVSVVDLGLAGSTPEKVRVRAGGRSLLRLDRGGPPGEVGPPTAAVEEAVAGADVVLVSDYGRGVAVRCRDVLGRASARTPVVWDPHPRGRPPVPGARLATPNIDEARRFGGGGEGTGLAAVAELGRRLVRRWRVAGVAVTMGDRGALLAWGDGPPMVVPAGSIGVGDPCGAGDRFASSVAGLLADGAMPSEAVTGAVAAASEFVAAGGAATMPRPQAGPPHGATADDVTARVRARGGTVVATSGCFDLVHAGHISTLRAARGLGDCLIVCLNSDASVRRLKGPGRPLVPEADRVAVLTALDAVDAVVVFDEDTPEAVLDRLRPDVFAKGGDYALADLPEARQVATWGGQAVVLPYVDGRSTTGLLKEVVRRGIA